MKNELHNEHRRMNDIPVENEAVILDKNENVIKISFSFHHDSHYVYSRSHWRMEIIQKSQRYIYRLDQFVFVYSHCYRLFFEINFVGFS
jgi:hypothetical protein